VKVEASLGKGRVNSGKGKREQRILNDAGLRK